MSNALLEYMAAGRAIVATDVGANARVVRDGQEGLIVPPGNDGALDGAIRTDAHRSRSRPAMRAAARETSREPNRLAGKLWCVALKSSSCTL